MSGESLKAEVNCIITSWACYVFPLHRSSLQLLKTSQPSKAAFPCFLWFFHTTVNPPNQSCESIIGIYMPPGADASYTGINEERTSKNKNILRKIFAGSTIPERNVALPLN